ncbi:hypothetical protein, partial [Corynebacterium striatum]|uniref:hypothetical protein n=1 Tax=Corynebacterium striatum TaxID=43770 RepID=UPI001955318A
MGRGTVGSAAKRAHLPTTPTGSALGAASSSVTQIQRAKQDTAEPAPTTNTTQGPAHCTEDRRQKLKRAQLPTKPTGSALDAA